MILKWNGPTLTQKSFKADLAFGPEIENEEVYRRTVGAYDVRGRDFFMNDALNWITERK